MRGGCIQCFGAHDEEGPVVNNFKILELVPFDESTSLVSMDHLLIFRLCEQRLLDLAPRRLNQKRGRKKKKRQRNMGIQTKNNKT